MLLAMTALQAANLAYFSASGSKQGYFAGCDSATGCAVIGYSDQVIMPVDSSSGLATGKAINKAVTITKLIDATSTKFETALLDNEGMDVTVNFATSAAQSGYVYYTVALHGAKVTGVRHYMPSSADSNYPLPQNSMVPLEEITLSYQEIQWTTWAPGAKQTGTADEKGGVAYSAPASPSQGTLGSAIGGVLGGVGSQAGAGSAASGVLANVGSIGGAASGTAKNNSTAIAPSIVRTAANSYN
ncbi:Type VI secretion system effector, Hcp [uncultured archaeon]|nr:Type VI secretion system effector, Hcp [uncultured archaeon]